VISTLFGSRTNGIQQEHNTTESSKSLMGMLQRQITRFGLSVLNTSSMLLEGIFKISRMKVDYSIEVNKN
jgi:hypothetical protein